MRTSDRRRKSSSSISKSPDPMLVLQAPRSSRFRPIWCSGFHSVSRPSVDVSISSTVSRRSRRSAISIPTTTISRSFRRGRAKTRNCSTICCGFTAITTDGSSVRSERATRARTTPASARSCASMSSPANATVSEPSTLASFRPHPMPKRYAPLSRSSAAIFSRATRSSRNSSILISRWAKPAIPSLRSMRPPC